MPSTEAKNEAVIVPIELLPRKANYRGTGRIGGSKLSGQQSMSKWVSQGRRLDNVTCDSKKHNSRKVEDKLCLTKEELKSHLGSES